MVQVGGLTVEKGNILDERLAINEQKATLQKEITWLKQLA